jgi:hypothetical protein
MTSVNAVGKSVGKQHQKTVGKTASENGMRKWHWKKASEKGVRERCWKTRFENIDGMWR